MICIPLAGLVSLLQCLGVSLGGLGILAVIAELTDDYTDDLPPVVLEGETEGHL